jgi:hypothetical protein
LEAEQVLEVVEAKVAALISEVEVEQEPVAAVVEEWVQVVGSASVVELALLVEWAAVLDLEEELVEDWVVAVVQDLEEAPASEVEEEWVVAVVSEEEVAREAGLAPERA